MQDTIIGETRPSSAVVARSIELIRRLHHYDQQSEYNDRAVAHASSEMRHDFLDINPDQKPYGKVWMRASVAISDSNADRGDGRASLYLARSKGSTLLSVNTASPVSDVDRRDNHCSLIECDLRHRHTSPDSLAA